MKSTQSARLKSEESNRRRQMMCACIARFCVPGSVDKNRDPIQRSDEQFVKEELQKEDRANERHPKDNPAADKPIRCHVD